MTTHYKADDPNLLISVLIGEGVHLEPGAVIDGLTADQAHAKPHGLPHSIAEIVAHICYWQEWFNNCAVVGYTGIAKHAVDGWPAVSPDGWDALRKRYLHSIDEAKRIAAESDCSVTPYCHKESISPSLPKSRAGLASSTRQCTAAIIWVRSLRSVSCWVCGRHRREPSRGRRARTLAPGAAPGPALDFSVLTQQLGLRLQSERGPVEISVIDHAEHPNGTDCQGVSEYNASSTMRWSSGVVLLSVGVILVLQTPIYAQTDDTPLPVSLDRIRAALIKPPPLLAIPAPSDDSPTFRVEVREQRFDLRPIDEKPFDLTYGLPSAGELLMRGIGKIQSGIVNYKRGRAERRARKEVEDALAAFFAYSNVPRSTTSATEK